MTSSCKIRQVGEFIIQYQDQYNVAISWKGHSWLPTQLVTSDMLKKESLTPSKDHLALHFEGNIYPGIIFHIPGTMSHENLEKLLENLSPD